ncbi:hypothetical protein HC891_25085 [Candidatus Gracilibacteria bacterium]|nr:hypothetical protein [Candidatus Gracilibacteria bacterium]
MLALSDVDAVAAWVYAAIHTIVHFDELLENEWHERAAVRCVDLALEELAAVGRLPRKADERARVVAERLLALRAEYRIERLGPEWTARRPFAGPDADPIDGYVAARRRAFDAYLAVRLEAAPPELRMRARARYDEWRGRSLEPYLAQMTIAKTLYAEGFCERREALSSETLCVALHVGGVYHLIDIWERDERRLFSDHAAGRRSDTARPESAAQPRRGRQFERSVWSGGEYRSAWSGADRWYACGSPASQPAEHHTGTGCSVAARISAICRGSERRSADRCAAGDDTPVGAGATPCSACGTDTRGDRGIASRTDHR